MEGVDGALMARPQNVAELRAMRAILYTDGADGTAIGSYMKLSPTWESNARQSRGGAGGADQGERGFAKARRAQSRVRVTQGLAAYGKLGITTISQLDGRPTQIHRPLIAAAPGHAGDGREFWRRRRMSRRGLYAHGSRGVQSASRQGVLGATLPTAGADAKPTQRSAVLDPSIRRSPTVRRRFLNGRSPPEAKVPA